MPKSSIETSKRIEQSLGDELLDRHQKGLVWLGVVRAIQQFEELADLVACPKRELLGLREE